MAETYTTRALAEFMIPELAEKNIKGATREVRKFLRDELGGGRAVVGKGSRYALEYNKRELNALKKKFNAWQVAQEAEKAKRAELRAAAQTAAKAEDPAEPVIEDNSDIEDNTDEEVEGPDDAELAQMMAELAEEAESDTEDNEA